MMLLHSFINALHVDERCIAAVFLGDKSTNHSPTPDDYRYVLVLYLYRPFVSAERGRVLVGRFRYSDLKEAAFSGAAVLWALNRLQWVPVARGGGLVTF